MSAPAASAELAAPAPASPAAEAPPRVGALIGVCGLGGGVGASALAQLLATAAARRGPGPVLLADAGGPLAALAARLGAEAPLSLADTAKALERQALAQRPFGELGSGLRLLARLPSAEDGPAVEGLETLLGQARRAHALSLLDCATLQRPIERQALACCDSVLWVSTMAPGQLERAPAALASLTPIAPARQLLAVREQGGRGAERRARELAERCGLPVVLVPTLDARLPWAELAERALVELQPQLEAMIGALR